MDAMLNAFSDDMQAHLAALPAKLFYMGESFKDRMKRLRIRAGFESHAEAAAAIGCKRGIVSMWEAPSSNVKQVSGKHLLRTAAAYKVHPEYLNTGEGEDGYPTNGSTAPISQSDATITHPSPARSERVTVRGAAMVGEDGFWQELEDVGDAYVEWRTRHGDEYAIEIRSDRFHPEIRRGALVIFSPSKVLAFNEYALVKLRDGRSTILEFLRQDGDLYTFTALQSGGRRLSLGTSEIEHVHAYAGMAPASDKQTD